MNRLRSILVAAPFALLAAACSEQAPPPAVEDSAASSEPAPDPAPAPVATTSATPAASDALTLDGFADLVIGEPVPAASDFKIRGAQISDACLIYSSPEHPGLYAIIEQGTVRRITVARDSTVRLVEGVGVGSTEQEVLAAFPGFVASSHEYVAAPGKYLQQPGSNPRLRFEIDENGRVSAMHVGMRPQLEYVEGCA